MLTIVRHAQKCLLRLIAVVLLATLAGTGVSSAQAQGAIMLFAGGSGTDADPYLVATAEHLSNVRNHLNSHFRQIADIDLGVAPWNIGEGWSQIGSSKVTGSTPSAPVFASAQSHTNTGQVIPAHRLIRHLGGSLCE